MLLAINWHGQELSFDNFLRSKDDIPDLFWGDAAGEPGPKALTIFISAKTIFPTYSVQCCCPAWTESIDNFHQSKDDISDLFCGVILRANLGRSCWQFSYKQRRYFRPILWLSCWPACTERIDNFHRNKDDILELFCGNTTCQLRQKVLIIFLEAKMINLDLFCGNTTC